MWLINIKRPLALQPQHFVCNFPLIWRTIWSKNIRSFFYWTKLSRYVWNCRHTWTPRFFLFCGAGCWTQGLHVLSKCSRWGLFIPSCSLDNICSIKGMYANYESKLLWDRISYQSHWTKSAGLLLQCNCSPIRFSEIWKFLTLWGKALRRALSYFVMEMLGSLLSRKEYDFV